MVTTGVSIKLLIISEFDILFGIFTAISAILGIVSTQFSRIGMRFDGLILLILQLVFTFVVFLITDKILDDKVINLVI